MADSELDSMLEDASFSSDMVSDMEEVSDGSGGWIIVNQMESLDLNGGVVCSDNYRILYFCYA